MYILVSIQLYEYFPQYELGFGTGLGLRFGDIFFRRQFSRKVIS